MSFGASWFLYLTVDSQDAPEHFHAFANLGYALALFSYSEPIGMAQMFDVRLRTSVDSMC